MEKTMKNIAVFELGNSSGDIKVCFVVLALDVLEDKRLSFKPENMFLELIPPNGKTIYIENGEWMNRELKDFILGNISELGDNNADIVKFFSDEPMRKIDFLELLSELYSLNLLEVDFRVIKTLELIEIANNN